jgi:hypothetical protein
MITLWVCNSFVACKGCPGQRSESTLHWVNLKERSLVLESRTRTEEVERAISQLVKKRRRVFQSHLVRVRYWQRVLRDRERRPVLAAEVLRRLGMEHRRELGSHQRSNLPKGNIPIHGHKDVVNQ